VTPDETVSQVHAGHRRLTSLISELSDADVRAASALPGWSRGHVITHLAELAQALTRQVDHALRDELVDVYDGGRPARDAAIERGAGRSAEAFRESTALTCAALEDAWARLGPEDWARPVSYRDGTLLDILHARWRETEIHLTDLDLGYRPSSWTTEFCDHTVRFLAPRVPDGIQLTLAAVDRRWVFGTGAPLTVHGSPGDLTAWMAGRISDTPVVADGGALPELGPWP
jgi:maleylpyruvate isomerase